jgi:hypothetical protein
MGSRHLATLHLSARPLILYGDCKHGEAVQQDDGIKISIGRSLLRYIYLGGLYVTHQPTVSMCVTARART